MSTKKVISEADWMQRMSRIAIPKSDLNALVLNFLSIEGYQSAATAFMRESHLPFDLGGISERMHIREAVQSGNIDLAIDIVNDLDPEILDSNQPLLFHLLLQKLVELLRSSQQEAALQFSQEELAPRGIDNPAFLEELEHTMALFAFDNLAALPGDHPLAPILDPAQRLHISSELNAAILASRGAESDSDLATLMRLLRFGQEKLAALVVFPRIRNFDKGYFE